MKDHFFVIVNLLLICKMLIPGSLLAQDADNAATEKLLASNVRDFIQSYAAISETGDKEAVLRYLSPKSQSTIFYFSISENVRLQNSNYEGFSTYLEKLSNTVGMDVKYEFKEIIRNHVNGDVAIVIAIIDYELKETGGFHVRGSETVSFAWKKIGNSWKIVHFMVMGIEDEKLRGTCLCEVFASSEGKYVVRTTMPGGRSYQTSYHEFHARKTGGATIIKTTDNEMFTMKSDGEVWLRDNSSSSVDKMHEVQPLGKARDVKEAILLIIREHLHEDHCTNIKAAN